MQGEELFKGGGCFVGRASCDEYAVCAVAQEGFCPTDDGVGVLLWCVDVCDVRCVWVGWWCGQMFAGAVDGVKGWVGRLNVDSAELC